MLLLLKLQRLPEISYANSCWHVWRMELGCVGYDKLIYQYTYGSPNVEGGWGCALVPTLSPV